LHQAVARVARHRLVRVSAALCAAETRQLRKVQDVSKAKQEIKPHVGESRGGVAAPALPNMGFLLE